MQLQAIIVIFLAASAFAANETTTAKPIDCGLGTGIGALLEQVGNLLDGILANVEQIRIAGVAGDSRDLINLKNLLNQVRILLTSLLGGGDPNTTADHNSLLSGLIFGLTTVLDNLLGAGSGEKMACQSGGALGNLIQNLLNGIGLGDSNNPGLLGLLLGPLLNPILGVVGQILQRLL